MKETVFEFKNNTVILKGQYIPARDGYEYAVNGLSNIKFSVSNGIATVQVPYQVKNIFKDEFKSAKWNASDKSWSVKTTVDALQKWAAAVTAMSGESTLRNHPYYLN